MANTIELAQKFLPVLDEIYKKSALSSILDAATQVNFDGTNTVKVMKVATTGLGDYSRANGYSKGNVTVEWESFTLTEDRSAELEIDRMDNEETLGQAFGMAVSEFNRVNVGPEVDAYRFAKYAAAAGQAGNVGTDALADGAAVIAALRKATTAMDEAEVPAEDRVLFITPTLKGVVDDMDTTKSKEVFKRFSAVIEVPQTRFYTEVTMNSGASEWGYEPSGAPIDFLVVAKSAAVQAKKLALPKIFTPDENQSKDAWKFQYRLYHDAMVYQNKASGVYVHYKDLV